LIDLLTVQDDETPMGIVGIKMIIAYYIECAVYMRDFARATHCGIWSYSSRQTPVLAHFGLKQEFSFLPFPK